MPNIIANHIKSSVTAQILENRLYGTLHRTIGMENEHDYCVRATTYRKKRRVVAFYFVKSFNSAPNLNFSYSSTNLFLIVRIT